MPPDAGRTGHAFISYMREDTAVVNRLQRALEYAGIDVWCDGPRPFYLHYQLHIKQVITIRWV